MRKLHLFCFILLGCITSLNAQPYNNEWISFASGQPHSLQQYFKVSVWKQGIFRLTYSDLQNSGVPVNSWFSLERYQMFHDGNEQYINMGDVDNNGIFNAGDYIEFYGTKNDGRLDTQIYDLPSSQPNQFQSLFNDTAAYFVTYNLSSTNNKRMLVETDQNFGSYISSPYLIDDQVVSNDGEYNIGGRDGNDIADNSYTAGEGWYFPRISFGVNQNINFNIKKYLSTGIQATVDYSIMGANSNAHPYTIKLDAVPVDSFYFFGYFLEKRALNIYNLPINGTAVLSVVPDNDPSNPNNRNYINTGYVRLRYSRQVDFTGETFPQTLMVPSFGAKTTLNLSNTGLANPRMYIISGDTIRLINYVNAAGNITAVVPTLMPEQRMYLMENSSAFSSSGNVKIEPVNRDADPTKFARFNNFLYNGGNADFIIISNKSIWTGATNYANYRATKGYTPLLVDVNELYDQYGWGIRRHPQSIRSFTDFLIDSALVYPKYMLMLGKAIKYLDAKRGVGYDMNLVPTFGEPASDHMFTSKLNTPDFVPEIATGRVSAQNEADVSAYLNKLIEFEANQNQAPSKWMKNVLHFGGGTSLGEQNNLALKLNGYKVIVEDTLFGGTVSTFLKSSNAPIQINQSEYLQSLIDSGCSMMTFYGHAAGTSFDISTDAPENYNNQGRYPLVLAQSCFVGDIFSTSRLLNERFVLTPNKAAIAFMAVPDKGLIDELDTYSTEFHNELFRMSYGKGLAVCMKETIKDVLAVSQFYKGVCMNMTLHGDPAININSYQVADYSVENAGISFSPKEITTEIDSFDIHIALANLGMNTNQTSHVLFSRTMPDGITKRDTIIQIPYVSFQDTFSVRLPVDFKDGAGLNNFEITADVYNEVNEYNEVSNNIAKASLVINSTDINPVYPQEYAIIPQATPVLKAITSNLFAAPKSYRFELDTTVNFNSQIKKTGVVNNAFGIVSWQVPSTLDSNQVYYWRVANDSITSLDTSIANNFQWRLSSFMYKANITGWSQADFPQFTRDDATNMEIQDSIRYFDYVNANFALGMTHIGNRPSYEINGVNMDYGGCGFIRQIAVAVLDSIEFEHPWQTDSCVRTYGNYNYFSCVNQYGCNRSRPDKFFLFNMDVPSNRQSLIEMIRDSIPNGNYILSWNVFCMDFDTITMAPVKNAFLNLGVNQYPTLTDADKYMLFMKKGDPSSVQFVKGLCPTEDIGINYVLQRNWDKGYITSTKIGPAKSWSEVHWNTASVDPGVSPDSVSLQVYGVNINGQETLLIDNIFSTNLDINISSIDATIYPYLKLKLYAEDLVNRTPPQLTKWQVYYEPVPEGSLNTAYYSSSKDTVQEGESITLSMAFENISSVKMDSLLVDFYLFDNGNVRRDLGSIRAKKELVPGDTIMAAITFSSRDYLGNNVLWVEANPRNDQPEQFHFNNLTNRRFTVTRDITNPLLDVTFDGTHILNGDIISSRPEIKIQLLDENKFIALNDTSNFRINLKEPDGVTSYLSFESLPGSSTNSKLLKWIPATLPKNSFRIDYIPNLQKDGTYELQVEAKDESGNLSGTLDYKIQFEVINKSTITEIVNYPNPFSTSTRFVFTLTGSEVPTDFSIQIMTVTGKIVREINKQEIGNIRIGRNITEFAWDGKDQFGDQLANGVYLYRVRTTISGNTIEKRETELDQYFKKGWGKMYLLK
jgi:hypothetical protein